MRLEPSDEQRQILDSVDRFMAGQLPPAETRRRDREQDPPYHLLRSMGDAGFISAPFPEAVGGLGRPWTTVVLMQERMASLGLMAASLFTRTVTFGGMALMSYGSEAQKQALMPALIRGELLFAFALTEPGAGTDAAAIETRAERHDGGWRLNGRKTWISDADRADYIIMPCRTGPRGGGKHGISMFLVPRSSAGLHMSVLPKAGHNCMPSWDVGVDDVLLWTWPSSMQRRAGSSGQRWEISRSSHLCWRTCYDPALTDRRWPALSQGVGAGAGEIDRS